MLTSSTVGTAALRALYAAIIAGLVAGITTYQTTDDTKAAILTGALAALSMLGYRGVGEGAYDAKRQDEGKVSKADVQPGKGQP